MQTCMTNLNKRRCYITSVFGKKTDPRELERQGMMMMRKNQPKAAAVLFGQAIKQDPNNRQAHYNRGIALNQIRKYSDAITCFDEALRLDPENVPALNNKAIAMAELGDTDGAKLCYADAIKLSYSIFEYFESSRIASKAFSSDAHRFTVFESFLIATLSLSAAISYSPTAA